MENEPAIETWPVGWTRSVHWNASRQCVGQHAPVVVEVQPASSAKLATTEESRGLEIQNRLLDDMKAAFQEFLGR